MKNRGEEMPAVTKEFSLANARMSKVDKQWGVVLSILLLKKTYLNSTISANGFRGLLAGASFATPTATF